jgi:PmbA protein
MIRTPRLQDLAGLAEDLVDYGRSRGADEIEVSISDGREFQVDIRRGRIENLVEAGSTSLGLRVIKDKRTAGAGSSDLSPDVLRALVRGAVRRAGLSEPDACSGLAPCEDSKIDISSLDLHDPVVEDLDAETKIGLARRTERIALADKRIVNSYGAGCATQAVTTILANSGGFSGSFRQTFCSLSLGLQAGSGNALVEDFWFSARRRFRELDPPETVARIAVERTLRQLHPRKIPTCSVPVIFEPMETSWLLGFLFSCVSGTAVYQKASFLSDRLGTRIGNPRVTVIDDGLKPGGPGTRPFDADGLPCRRTVVVDKGILKSFLCNTYAARKLKLASTGNSDGSGVSPGNFYLKPGKQDPRDIAASLDRGLILTRTLGHGLNPVTGDISRGAFGLWVEKGEIVHPVAGITIAGNLEGLLRNLAAVGNDLDFLSPFSGPTVMVGEMTVGGAAP